jgi:uncharacterized protein
LKEQGWAESFVESLETRSTCNYIFTNSLSAIQNSLEIPEHCGAILLPDVTLFPHGAMPLHIFEPRYREMLSDALESNCMICVGTLLGKESKNPAECAAPIGTIGLIRASREQEDGRSNLLLHGILRIRFNAWLDEKPYPFANIEPAPSKPLDVFESKLAVDNLRGAVDQALRTFPDETKERVKATLDRAQDNPAILADAVAQQFIQNPSMRRQLLEEPEVAKRMEFLADYLRNATRDERN